jgi:photosystem II stability/assembly factor-like uncharacterized protein
MLRILFTVLLVLTLIAPCLAESPSKVHQPRLTAQISGTTQGLIAVSPVNERVVWASGRGGTYVVTTNGGQTWRAGVVPGAEELQFRDVQGVSDKIAYLLSIGSNPTDFRIYKTEDGGATWTIQFRNQKPKAFYDCFAFWTPQRGIAHSDSVEGKFPDLRTTNGATWQFISNKMPPALPGEASFSASGTCVTTEGEANAWIATGGSTVARVLATRDGGDTWNAYGTPLVSSPSGGAITVDFRNPWNGMVAGGDLASNDAADAATSKDGGQTWTLTKKPPVKGAIFCLSFVAGSNQLDAEERERYERTVVVTAETGPDFNSGAAAWTPDEGNTWFELPDVSGYWGVAFASPKAGWFVGVNGSILKISFLP